MKQKLKTKKALKKRFKVTAKGKLKRGKASKSHLLSGKTTKRKRKLRRSTTTADGDQKMLKKGMPYS